MPATAAPKAPRSSTAITSAPAFLRAADTAATCSVAPVTATVEPTVSPLRRRCHPMVANEGSDTGSPPESCANAGWSAPPRNIDQREATAGVVPTAHASRRDGGSVSYTHLTLPTIYSV